MNKYQPIIYKSIAILLAWFAWLVPLGLHRVMMRRRYAWLHPVAFLSATLASNQFFFRTPENAEVGRLFVEQGIAPHFGQFAHVWLLCFTIAWMLIVIYDAIMIFSWSVNDSYEPHKLVAEARRMASSGGWRKEHHEQVADHDQTAQ